MATFSGEDRDAHTMLWRIENISCYEKGFHGDGIESPGDDDTFGALSFYLALYPRGCSLKDKQVRLRAHFYESLIPVKYEFSFLACDGSTLVTREGCFDDYGYIAVLDMPDCLTEEELFVTKKSAFLPHDTLTIRFRIWQFDKKFPNSVFVSCRSRIEFSEVSAEWQIGSGWNALNSDKSETTRVNFKFIHETVHCDLKCSLSCVSEQNTELQIEVTSNEKRREYRVKLEVSVWGDGREITKLGGEEVSFTLLKSRRSLALPKFVLRKNSELKTSLQKCGENVSLVFCLTAVCRDISNCIEKVCPKTSNFEPNCYNTTSPSSGTSSQNSGQNADNTAHLQQKSDCLSVLVEDFSSLYQKQTFSDFELRTGDVSFPVHKSILSARSPVFCSMFSSQMKESNSKCLDVPDLDVHSLNRLLTFLYTGNVEPDLAAESAADLYYAADKYQVDSLKSLCSSILQSRISVSNASDILTLADKHQDSNLMSFVHDFILDHFDDVMNSDEWEKFTETNSVLAAKSLHQLCKKKAVTK